MADCNLSFQFQGSAQALFNAVQQKVQSEGGTLTGNASGGTFSISKDDATVSGSYSINGQTLGVVIEHKTFFITCDRIQGFIQNFLNSNVAV